MKRCVLICIALLNFSQLPAQDRLLTLEEIYHPEKRLRWDAGMYMGLTWLKDGEHYIERVMGQGAPLMKVNATTGEKKPFLDADKLKQAFDKLPGISREDAAKKVNASNPIITPNETGVLLYHLDDLFYFEIRTNRLIRLTNKPGAEKEAQASPDGRWVAYVRDNNLFVSDTTKGHERQLTKDGSPDLLNGLLDWVYQEEVYGRGDFRAFWWSPDSKSLAFLQLDESQVPRYPIVHHTDSKQKVEDTRYPRAGEPNPKVKLGVVEAEKGSVTWARNQDYKPEDMLIVRVGWSSDSTAVVYQVQNREQTWLDLVRFSARQGKQARIIREESKAWVNVIGEPNWMPDGSFLWLSDRTGWTHLYHYDSQGTLIKQLTSGDWKIGKLHGVDAHGQYAYLSAAKEKFYENHTYRLNLRSGEMIRLTDRAGSHSADFNPTFTMFADSWSTVDAPGGVTLVSTADKKAIRNVTEPAKDQLAPFRLSPPEFIQIKAKDGFPMEAMLIKPLNLDRSKKYPVLMPVYGGPEAPTVRNSWQSRSYLWHQFLAQKGYVILAVDGRPSSGKGVKSAWPVHRNLGELELRDLEEAIEWLGQQPYVDKGRIGIWGWSYGGYLTAYAMTHSKSFKAGIAGAPVTDWHLYDSIYTERYMGLPQKNKEGYEKSSVIKAAKNLNGRMLLIHGLIDDNVHLENSVQFMYELQKAGKEFDVMFYPNSRHGVMMPTLVWHMRQMMTDFILKNL